MKPTLILLVLLSSSFGYGQKVPVSQKQQPASGQLITIDVHSAYQHRTTAPPLSDLVEDIEFIPLETTDNCLLDGNLADIVVTAENILVFDYNLGYRFNRKGKFINRIGKRGQGPEELIKPMSMEVDTTNKCVYFIDRPYLVMYDYNGKYLSRIKIDLFTHKALLYGDQQFAIQNRGYDYGKPGDRYGIYFFSGKEGKFVARMACEHMQKRIPLSMSAPFPYLFNNEVYVKDVWSDTIYRVKTPLDLEAYAVVNRGKLTARTTDDTSLYTGKTTPNDQLVIEIYRIMETSRFMFFATNKGTICHDKVKKVTSFAEWTESGINHTDDLYGGPGIKPLPDCVSGNSIQTYRHTADILGNTTKNHRITGSQFAHYQQMVNKLDPEDNPVIMILRLH